MRPNNTVKKMPATTSQNPHHSFMSLLSCHHWNKFLGFELFNASEITSNRSPQKGYSLIVLSADVRYIKLGSWPRLWISALSQRLQLALVWVMSRLIVATVSSMNMVGSTLLGMDSRIRLSTET